MTSPKGPTGRRLWKSEWKQSWIQISPACIMNPLSSKIHLTSFRLQLRRWSGWSSTLSCFNSKIVAPSAWRPTDLSLSTTTFLGSQEKSWHHRHPVWHWYMICNEYLLSIFSMYSFTVSHELQQVGCYTQEDMSELLRASQNNGRWQGQSPWWLHSSRCISGAHHHVIPKSSLSFLSSPQIKPKHLS